MLLARLELENQLLQQALGLLPFEAQTHGRGREKLAALEKNWPGRTL